MNTQAEQEIRADQVWRGHGTAEGERVTVIAILDKGEKILLERAASKYPSAPLRQMFRVTPWQLRAAYELDTDAPRATLDRDTAIGFFALALALDRDHGDVGAYLREHFAITDDEIREEIEEMARST